MRCITVMVFLETAMICTISCGELYTAEQAHIISCIKDILQRDFKDTKHLVVSLQEVCRDSIPRKLDILSSSPEQYHQLLVDELLKVISNFTLVQLKISSTMSDNEYEGNDDERLIQGYIMLLFSCKSDEDSIEDVADSETTVDNPLDYVLEEQIAIIMEKLTFNPNAKFIFIIPDTQGESSDYLAHRFTNLLWKDGKLTNFIILIPNFLKNVEVKPVVNIDIALNLYTWIPFEGNTCEKVDKIVLLNQWIDTSGGQFLRNVTLYPFSLPKDFHECPLIVGALGTEPYVIVDKNHNGENGKQNQELNGLGLNLLHTFAKKYNFTLSFTPYENVISSERIEQQIKLFLNDEIHIAAGSIALTFSTLRYGDVSEIIIYDQFRYLVPCPLPIGKVSRLLKTFSRTVWLSLILVLFISSFLIVLHSNNLTQEYMLFSNFSYCLYSNWAVLLGISAPAIPVCSRNRQFFALYVWYCFAINLVFQTYFVTYLVEPGYDKGLETLEELRLSKITYGYLAIADELISTTDNINFKTVAFSVKECFDLFTCTEDVMFERSSATLTSYSLPWYVAKKRGVLNVDKVICFLKENSTEAWFGFYFRRGNPLRKLLNKHIHRVIEGGLQEKYKSEVEHEALLSAENVYVGDEMYSVFTLTNLWPIFLILIFGCLASACVFLGEVMITLFKKKILSKGVCHKGLRLPGKY
ncbi:Ionotropic receptor 631 [Blattella germanica]|nr:Ionotropic receptor 631 [Blattella germanica]